MMNNEIDFIASKGDRKMYLQVAVHVGGEKTCTCEFGNLLQIRDNQLKHVETLDEYTAEFRREQKKLEKGRHPDTSL